MTKDTRFPRAAPIVNMRARRAQEHSTKLIVGEVLDHRAGTVVASGSL
jgi:hypothetical protein